MDEETRLRFKIQAKKHFVVACTHVLEKSALTSNVVRSCRCLQPERRQKDVSVGQVAKLARALPLHVDVGLLQDEWRLLQLEKNVVVKEDVRIDTYWSQFFEIKASNGELKYPTVAQVVKAALCLSHGNAELEKGFSDSARYLTEDKANMSERTLNAAMTVKSGMRSYSYLPQLVPASKELLDLARHACANYKAFLEEQRKKNEEEQQAKDDEMARMIEEEENRKQLDKTRENIESEEIKLKDLQKNQESKRKIEAKLFEEASKRLKTGLQKKDFAEVEMAKALLEGVKEARKEMDSEKKKVDTATKEVDRKKNSLISRFFKKK